MFTEHVGVINRKPNRVENVRRMFLNISPVDNRDQDFSVSPGTAALGGASIVTFEVIKYLLK